MTEAEIELVEPKTILNWTRWRRPLLQLTCVLIGSMMLYRGIMNLFGYPSEWMSLFPNVPLLSDICRIPSFWERWMLGPIFLGGVFGIVLMWRELRVGWWIFTALNFLVGIWFIFILEDIWQHHVAPHIIFSAVFLPFYPKMKRSKTVGKLKKQILGRLGGWALKLLQIRWVAHLIHSIPSVHNLVNKLMINAIVERTRPRPHPFSTQSGYTSWASLTDKTWSARHLGIQLNDDRDPLPDPDSLKPLFKRPAGEQRMCPKSTCLFPAFAQYLTDGFLRTVPVKDPKTGKEEDQKRKRNTSTHEIDMCTLYGRMPAHTHALRIVDPTQEQRGMLISEFDKNGEEFPPRLFKNGKLDKRFECLDLPLGLEKILAACKSEDPKKAEPAKVVRDAIFAVGGDRVNSVPQVSMMNTLWLREHNRLAREIGQRNPAWDDNRVFETARNIIIVQFIKIVVEDYINHVAPTAVSLMADPKVAWKAAWNKPNFITTEFSLLYRWHSLIPDTIVWGGQELVVEPSYFLNNLPLLSVGLKRGFEDISAQAAAELGPRNTNNNLLHIEVESIKQGRVCELASYNAYRKYLGSNPVKSFEEISSDPEVVKTLRDAYGDVKNVDFFVGIFCEDRVKASPLPQTILGFVALDAFSQALPNPLLSEHVFTPPEGFDEDPTMEHPTFTRYGWEQIQACTTLREVLARNISNPETLGVITMTRPSWNNE